MTRIQQQLIAAFGSLLFTLPAAAAAHDGANVSALPPAAQASVSAAVGKDNPAYYVRSDNRSLHAASAQLSTDFSSRGVQLRKGNLYWDTALTAYGRGTDLRSVAYASPNVLRNRVEYRHGALSEWYENGPLGLEQGFTLQDRIGEGAQPVTIALSLGGNLKASVDSDRTSLTLTDSDGRAVLRYAGLSAIDANGKALDAWLELHDSQLLVKVDDAAARYPVVIDPLIQLAELTTTNHAFLNYIVATSGTTVVVGDPNTGAAYVFVKPITGWTNMTETATLTGSDTIAADEFGTSVAVSGGVIAVGAPTSCIGINSPTPGAIYVFVKPSTGWASMTQTAKLTASDGSNGDCLGKSVAIGTNTIVAGAPDKAVNGNEQQGALYVFLPNRGWRNGTQTAELTASDGAPFDFLGRNVSISVSSTASNVAAGLKGNRADGAAYVFTKPATGWISANQTAEFSVSGAVTFGQSVAINGTTLVVGDPSASVATKDQGAAYVFVEPTSGWASTTSFNAQLSASDGQLGDQFGYSVGVLGNRVIVGAPFNLLGGSIYVFNKPTTGWQTSTKFANKLLASNQASDGAFAQGIALGSFIVAGGGGQGEVYVFGP